VLRAVVTTGGLQATRGFAGELLALFARLHGIELEVVWEVSEAKKFEALLAGRADLLGSSTITEERAKVVDFTTGFFPRSTVAINRKPRPVLATLAQLRKERVGTMRNSSSAERAEKAGISAKNTQQFDSTDAAMDALRSNRVSAVVTGSSRAFVEQKTDDDLQIGVSLGEPSSVAFAVRKDEPELRKALDDFLVNVRRSGKWSQLVVKYFGAEALQFATSEER